MRSHTVSAAVLAALVLAVAAVGQSTVQALLGRLGSSDWRERSSAFDQIQKSPGALQDQQVRSALLAALDAENKLIRSTLRESGGALGVSDKYGEGYSEYVADLLGSVSSFADFSDPAVLRVLAQSPYNPDSKFAGELALHADGLIPVLTEDASSDVPLIRGATLLFIGSILHNFRPDALRAEDATTLMHLLSDRAAHDTDQNARSAAAIALQRMADVNGDGKVDCADLALVRSAFGQKAGAPGFDRRADIGLRGVVDETDVAYVSKYLPVGVRCNP